MRGLVLLLAFPAAADTGIADRAGVSHGVTVQQSGLFMESEQGLNTVWRVEVGKAYLTRDDASLDEPYLMVAVGKRWGGWSVGVAPIYSAQVLTPAVLLGYKRRWGRYTFSLTRLQLDGAQLSGVGLQVDF